MAEGNLTIKAKVETEEAKRKMADLGSSVEGSMDRASEAIERTEKAFSKSADAAAKSAKATKDVAEQSALSAREVKALVTAFSGLGLSLASRYAARNFEEDSFGRKAWDYAASMGSGAVNRAVTGAMVSKSPYGAVVGGIVGAVEGGIDQYNENAAKEDERERLMAENSRLYERFMEVASASAELERFMKSLGDTTRSVALRTSEATERLEKERKRLEELKERAQSEPVRKDQKAFSETMGDLARQMNVVKGLENALNALSKADERSVQRAGNGQFDALARIGGMIGGATGDGVKDVVFEQRITNRKIESVSVGLERVLAKMQDQKARFA